MGTGEYVCVTLRGGAPWGFTLREGEGDACRSIQVHQVEEGGHAFLAGVRDGDEVVSINGEPCADLTLSEASALIDTSTDCLQLLVKRYTCIDFESDGTHFNEKESLREPLESTTLHIQSPKHGSQSPRELYISESQDETSYEELESNSEFSKGLKLFDTKQQGVRSCLDPVFQQKDDGVQLSFSPGDMIELQVSLTEQTSENRGCTSLGSARGIEGELSNREVSEAAPAITDPQCVPCPVREPLGQHGVVLSSPSMLGQVEVILQQQPAVSGAGRGIEAMGGSVGSQGEGGGDSEGVPQAFTVTFGVPSQDGTPADEQESDSDGDQDKPNKHRPRHARLRRGESLSEKQVKEAKSKCKRIALLLTAAPPNPNNKGVLMFKKHRQRAKKYTLVSYGTGDDEPEYSDEEDEENDDDKEEETHTVEFTFLASDDSEIDKHFLANTQSKKGVLTINWDKSLLEIERKLNSQAEMECLPETKGKGALMFAQRRQRMNEISAEHEELRRQGIPVEGVTEDEKKMVECSYVQATPAGHTYMDVNVHQPSQQQYQQYQQQQYYEQQQHYQQQQQYHQQYQQQQYEQQHYQQQQMYQQQQQYNQEQQQIQHYSSNMNGHLQTNGTQSSLSDHSVKPFSVQNTLATPYPPAMSGINQDSVGQGEQIASRDERISTPAIRTGILQDTRKRNTGKPMFTFKEAPKVSPNPALLNLLNRKDKKPGLESAPEEDYLSLGAEACNFLQNPNVKHKVPPPVAPKPMINPSSLPWSSQIEGTNQDMPQCAGNSISTPAVALTTEATPVTELEPMPAPASEPSHSPAQEQPPMSTTAEEQQAWDLQEPKPQQQLTEVPAQDEGGQVSSTIQPETEPVTSWGAVQMKTQQEPSTSWHPTQVQPLDPPPSPPQRPSWVAHQPSQAQTQPQSTMNTWTPQIQTSWSQGQEQTEVQTHAQVTWSQPQEQTQCHPPVQPSWTHSEQPHLQQTWGQHQEPMQQQPPPQWPQPLQADSESQPPWVRQSQQKSQLQPSWAQQGESESQAQPPWVQSQQAWPQTQTLGQSQPSYVSSGHPQQPLVSTWPPSQPQAQQNSWIQAAQTQSPVQPQAPLDSWASAPTQAQSQPSWSQNLQNQGQHVMNLWGQEQTQAQPQPAWAQSAPPQSTPPPNWQQSTPTTSPQPPVNMWNPTQVPSQTPMNTWVPQSQQTSTNISTAMVNIGATRPSAKPWHPLQDSPQRTPPPPPQRMHAFTIRQRNSPHVNPMATVLNPSSPGSAFEMPAVRGKGAEMFAKRQSRMEKFVVDSETVQANKATRSTSPAASLPNEWKYTTNVRAPPPRAYNPIQSPSYPPAATKQPPSALPTKAKKKGKDMPAPKPLNVVDVMKHQPYQLNSSLFIYGPAAEAAKPPSPKPDCSPHSPVQNQSIRYEQMAPVQAHNPINAPYSQQPYGMPLQQMMHDSHYQQTPTNAYHPASPYQQAYNQQYQQPPPSAYQTQTPQSPNPPYPQAPQASYQPANSHPYLGAPTVPYQLPISYDAPSFSGVARAESASGGTAVAPKPKFTAKKSAAQVWKPTGGDK